MSKQPFIKNAKSSFADEATGVAGFHTIPSAKGSKNQTDGGVSRKTGYRDRSAPSYIDTPKGI